MLQDIEDATTSLSLLNRSLGEQSVEGLSRGLMVACIIIPTFCILLFLLFCLLPKQRRGRQDEIHRELLTHAVITGGSAGIGYSIARQLVQRKCKVVSLLARGEAKLKAAKDELEALAKSIGNNETKICIYSADITNHSQLLGVAKEVCTMTNYGACENDQMLVPPTLLFNVAGTSSANKFLDTDIEEFEKLMKVNYFGSVYTTRAFLPYMINKKLKSTIVFTSSAAGQVGIFGFCAYSPTKYALRGLAEVLQMELSTHNIHVQICFPPDTDTEGYKAEMEAGKPEETHLISESAGLFQPDEVAKKMVLHSIDSRPAFAVYFGLEGWMLATLTAGMSPVHTFLDAICQIFLMGILRLISLFYLKDFRRMISKVAKEKAE